MQIYQTSRRNFLSSIAILSIGTAIGSPVTHFSSITDEEEDLQKKWKSYWKKCRGQKVNTNIDLQKHNNLFETKGHFYKNGEVIYFHHENILAQPTWIFWENNALKPADAIITLFENNGSLKKIARLNRFEMNALYKISREYYDDKLLTAHCNSLKHIPVKGTSIIKNKITITKNSQIQQVDYYKDQALVLNKKFIYHS